jgi:hypothetical protein
VKSKPRKPATAETLYKLTDANGKTRAGQANALQWGPNITHTAKRGKPFLCTETVIHAYRSPLLAVLMDPIQGSYGPTAHLWEARGIVATSDGTKVGCKRLKVVKQIPRPTVTREQRIRFAILAAQAVIGDSHPIWSVWANKWLSGEDRTVSAAASAAASAASVAAHAASAAAYAAAYEAADAAASAAYEEADAASYEAADAANAADAAASAAYALDLVALAVKAVREEKQNEPRKP